jgi:hypothetical protein
MVWEPEHVKRGRKYASKFGRSHFSPPRSGDDLARKSSSIAQVCECFTYCIGCRDCRIFPHVNCNLVMLIPVHEGLGVLKFTKLYEVHRHKACQRTF